MRIGGSVYCRYAVTRFQPVHSKEIIEFIDVVDEALLLETEQWSLEHKTLIDFLRDGSPVKAIEDLFEKVTVISAEIVKLVGQYHEDDYKYEFWYLSGFIIEMFWNRL